MEIITTVSCLHATPTTQLEQYINMKNSFMINLRKHFRSRPVGAQPRWSQSRIDHVINKLIISNSPEHVKGNVYYKTTYRMGHEGSNVYLMKQLHYAEDWVVIIAFENYYKVLWHVHRICGHGLKKLKFILKGNLYIPERYIEVFTKGCRYCTPMRLNTRRSRRGRPAAAHRTA